MKRAFSLSFSLFFVFKVKYIANKKEFANLSLYNYITRNNLRLIQEIGNIAQLRKKNEIEK